MPTAVTALVNRLKGFWNAFSVPQRTFALVGILGVVVGAVALAGWLGKPSMSAVYTDLSDSDAAAVIAQLDADGVDYQLAAGGTTVLVPSDQVDKLRVELAANGIPSQSDGYALLDQMGVGASEFQQEVTYQRAVEGELARTIQSIDGVSAATVHLAIPKETVYTEQATDPTASVFVDLKPGADFGGDSVRAVANLVSASVPHLKASDVSVVDAQGRDLTLSASDVTGEVSDRDAAVAAKVQAMLDRVLGAGKAAVTVDTDVNTDSTQRTTETYDATDGVPPLSSQTTTETYTGSGSTAGGVLGSDNIAVPNDSGTGTYSKEDTTLNNSVNKVTEQTTVAPGGVRRQSVSVVVDRAAAAGLSTGKLEDMVAAAAGIDEGRGDQLSVVTADFDSTTAQEAADALAQQQAADEAARKDRLLIAEIGGAIVVLILIAGALALRVRRKHRREREEEAAALEEEREAAARAAAAPPPGLWRDMDQEDSELVRTSVLPRRGEDPDEQMRSEIAQLADEDPAAVASTLREWLAVHP